MVKPLLSQVEGIEDPPVTEEQIEQARVWVEAMPAPPDVVQMRAYLLATQVQLGGKVLENERLRVALEEAYTTIHEQQMLLDRGQKDFVALSVEMLHILAKVREREAERVVQACTNIGMTVGRA